MKPFSCLRKLRISLRAFLLLCGGAGAASAMVATFAMVVGHTSACVQSLERLGVVVDSDFHERYGLHPPQRKGAWSGILEWSLASPVRVAVISARPADAGQIVEQVASLPTIRSLNVTATDVSRLELEPLTKLPRLEELGLVATSVDDAAIGVLGKLPHLRSLDLSETGISDAGLPQIAGLASLQSVTLNKTRVSKQGLRALHRSRPDLSVQPRLPQSLTTSSTESFLDDLHQTFAKYQVPAAEQKELLAIVESTRADIVRKL